MMTVIDVEKQKKKAEEKFISGHTDDKKIKLISLRLPTDIIKMIDDIIKEERFISRNDWIAKTIIKRLREIENEQ